MEGEGGVMSDRIQAQAGICPFCHDDHSAMTCYENKLKQENARLREALERHEKLLDEIWANNEWTVIEIRNRIRKFSIAKQALEAGDE